MKPRFEPFRPDLPLDPGVTLLEASAGTGKTWSITSLFVRLIAEREIPVQQILVVTFTEAATAELRDRIRRRLQLALEDTDRALGDPLWQPTDEVLACVIEGGRSSGTLPMRRRALKLALEGFDEAAIFTIHGFCRRMLQQNAFESRTEPEVELLADIRPLLDEVVTDFWTHEVHEAPPERLRLLDSRNVGRASLLDLAARVAANPDLVVQPAAPALLVRDPAAPGARFVAAYEKAAAIWAQDEAAIRALFAEAARDKALNGRRYPPAKLDERLTATAAWLTSGPRPGKPLPKVVVAFSESELCASANKGKEAPTHRWFSAMDQLVDADRALADGLDDEILALEHRLVDAVRKNLDRRKRELLVQSFDDLLRLLRDGLTGEGPDGPLRRCIREQYEAALIDEFQDTDPIQWAIFHRVFGDGGPWLTLIGDPKQAIYAFRGADIFTYLGAQKVAQRSFGLGKNYRSDEPLVEAVNHLFGRPTLESPFVFDDIGFDPVTAHHGSERLHVPGGSAPFEARFVRRTAENTSKRDVVIRKGWAAYALPAIVAADVTALLASGATIGVGDDERPVSARDVAVIVRKNKEARAVQEALRAAGIPSVLHCDEDVLATPEADELSRMMAAALEPSSARAVRTALATDLAGLNANEIDALSTNEEGWELWLERFRRWSALWADHGFMRMFRSVLSELELPERLLALPDGERRLTNLLHLAEILHGAAHAQDLKPAALASWLRIERGDASSGDDTRLLRLESDALAVEVVTVHRSKGLQYPVVFCPFLWDGQLVHKGEVRHLPYHDPETRKRTLDIDPDAGSESKLRHLALAEREALAESMRLLYVALTRAEHRCTLYWGLFNSAERSALAHLLHRTGGEPDASRGVDRLLAMSDDEILGELRSVAEASSGAIAVSVVEEPEGATVAAPVGDDTAAPIARTYDRTTPLDGSWRRSSFTQMTRSVGEPGKDYDEEPDAEQAPPPVVEGGAAVALNDLERSARTGKLLHKVLEEHDFQDPDRQVLRGLVERHMRGHGMDPEAWADRITDALRQVLDTPLGDDLFAPRLRDIPSSKRLSELDFDFPVSGGLEPAGAEAFTRRTLADVMRAHRSAGTPASYPRELQRLAFAPLRGFMTGSIDLVFEHAGRYYLVDYKSNHLGPTAAHYTPERLRAAMAHKHYFLQYHLYTVALHRYLAWRMGERYDYDAHVGGAWYLFLRGMSPETGPRTGVFFDRPSRELVTALSDRLGGGPPSVGGRAPLRRGGQP